MKNVEDKEQITNPTVNIIFIFYLQMNNNCRSVGFGMRRSKDDMSCVSTKSVVVFTQSLRVSAQSLELSAKSTKKLVHSPYVFSQLVDKWAQLTKGVQIMQGDYGCGEIGR